MRWTLPDGTEITKSADMKRVCKERGWDWNYYRNRLQKGMARRKDGPRKQRLPDDWRARLDSIFGPDAVYDNTREVPDRLPAIVAAPNATDTKWWHRLANASACICGVRGRINYVDVATGEQLKGNPRGTIIHLFADNVASVSRFESVMQPYGWSRRGVGQVTVPRLNEVD